MAEIPLKIHFSHMLPNEITEARSATQGLDGHLGPMGDAFSPCKQQECLMYGTCSRQQGCVFMPV